VGYHAEYLRIWSILMGMYFFNVLHASHIPKRFSIFQKLLSSSGKEKQNAMAADL
jgi:hypothetical protein